MLPVSFTPVLRLGRNLKGRDFFAGDVHGMLGLLVQALEQVDFDPESDRLLLAGDLVDRGNQSRACAALAEHDWVYSTRGNHEQMALESFSETGELLVAPSSMKSWLNNGLGWWLELTPAQRLPLLRILARLPLALEVDTPRGLVGVVHADVPAGLSWSQFTAALERREPTAVMTALWGRQRIESEICDGVPGIGRVFVGHTPQWQGLKRYGNVYALDTGAVYAAGGVAADAHLTLANVLTATATMVEQAQPVALLNVIDPAATAARPFGQGPGYTLSDRSNWLHRWRAPVR